MTETERTANRLAALDVRAAKRAIAALDADTLFALDVEFACRAALLGRPGAVTKVHAAIRAAA